MQYRKFGKNGDEISILGYGCMRFPTKGGRIDKERTEKQILMAIEKGVNYFDTAYIYPGSEAVLGEILEKHGMRDRVKIATKIPPYLVSSKKGMENLLKTQLERLRTDYIDYYLVHALADLQGWGKAKSSGMVEFLQEKKAQGVIKNIGFSYHGDQENFKKILDDFDWDFCQIQYNYIDDHNQAGEAGLRYAYSKGVGVSIMEPLRGGSLAGRMPEEIKGIWQKAENKRSYAEWALLWLWNQPEVSVVLSGLNEESHVEENCRIASLAQPNMLTSQELDLIKEVKAAFLKLMKVGCTGCSYCMPCPKGVNIPLCFSFYNGRHMFGERFFSNFQYLLFASDVMGGRNALASQCVACGKCERVCPQQLPVVQHLKSAQKALEPWWSKPFLGTARWGLKVIKLFSKKDQEAS
jgi:predicted aldo/keto reductase-like oxidoreductase